MKKIKILICTIALSVGSHSICYASPVSSIVNNFNYLVSLGVFCFLKGTALLDLEKSLIENGYPSACFNKMPKYFRSTALIQRWGILYTMSGIFLMIAPCITIWLANNKQYKTEQEALRIEKI